MKYLVVAAVLYALYFSMCYLGTGSVQKNMRWTNYSCYPDGLQEKIRKDERLSGMIPAEKGRAASFLSNLVLFTVVFALVALALGFDGFTGAFVYLLVLGEGLNLFDLLVIDMCWWKHSARPRIEGLGEEADYWDASKHVGSFVRALAVFALAAALAAAIVQVIAG